MSMDYYDFFATGSDLSMLKRIRERGDRWFSNGLPIGCLPSFFRSAGFDWARLRLFHTPSGLGAQCNDLPYTLSLANELKQAGFRILLCIHYSDTWADPAKQYPPKAWAGLDFETLEKTIYAYTLEVISRCVRKGCAPDMVQVGNEITPGMLWENGRVAEAHDTNTVHWHQAPSSNCKAAWSRFGRLLTAGIQAVHDASEKRTPVMIHIDRGGDISTNRWFFDNLLEQNVEFTAIGESYYPFWHGMPEDLAETIDFLGTRYGKEVYVAETAYPHRPHELYRHALRGDQKAWERLVGKYPLSPEGQKNFIKDVLTIAKSNSYCKGLFYWAPEWIPPQCDGVEDEPDAPSCWVRSLFDENGHALPALDVFGKSEERPVETL